MCYSGFLSIRAKNLILERWPDLRPKLWRAYLCASLLCFFWTCKKEKEAGHKPFSNYIVVNYHDLSRPYYKNHHGKAKSFCSQYFLSNFNSIVLVSHNTSGLAASHLFPGSTGSSEAFFRMWAALAQDVPWLQGLTDKGEWNGQPHVNERYASSKVQEEQLSHRTWLIRVPKKFEVAAWGLSHLMWHWCKSKLQSRCRM